MKAIDGSLIFQTLTGGSIFGGDYDGRLGPLTDWVHNNGHLFDGKTVLDLGSNAGHFPIEYVRAGARRVIAVEGRREFEDQWRQFSPLMPLDLSGVEWHTADVRDFDGRAQVVSCLGLLYHISGFMPKLREFSQEADLVLIEVQAGEEKDTGMDVETPDNRTMSLRKEKVLRGSADFWERLIHQHFGDAYTVSRVWMIIYGDAYKVKKKGLYGTEFSITLRSFYALTRIGTDINFMIDAMTGCADVTNQPVRIYQDDEPLRGGTR